MWLGPFIDLLSVLFVRMLLFWMQTCHVIRHVVICRPPVTIAFTHHGHADLLFLQTKPVFAYMSAARIFCFLLLCLFLLWMLGQTTISLSAANWVWFFWARRHVDAFMLAGPEQSSLFSSVFPFLPLLSSLSLPFLAKG